MRRNEDIAELAAMLRSRSALRADGWSERAIARAVRDGVLHRVRAGWYVDGGRWSRLWSESRHLLHVLAVRRDARRTPPVFGFASAAALWGLPLWGGQPSRVHVLTGTVDRRSHTDVMRHEGSVPDTDVVTRHGMLCTSLMRTIADLARTSPVEDALVAADAALQVVAGSARAYDTGAAEHWRDTMTERLAVRGARGIRGARRVVAMADGRADRPGESVSRLQLIRLGFRAIDLQVAVPGPRGDYHVDFGLDDVGALGEFDGRSKYMDEAQRGGRTLEEVLLREKEREDWIRGVTRRPLVRWGWDHIASPRTLGDRLARFGIRPPAR